jgi:heavy metal sensor kinase
MRRLPIRARLTLAFAFAMAVVLVAIGAFLYLRLSASLDEAIDESLQARAAGVATDVQSGNTVGQDGESDERFAQVLDGAGQVTAASGGSDLSSTPLLEPAAVATVLENGGTSLERDDVPGVSGRARMLATPVDVDGEQLVVIVGASLEDRDETVRGFLAELLIVGPAALVLMSILGYALATAALRPVESMQEEAAAISASEPGRRLTLPRSHDEIYRLGETLNAMLERLEAALEREREFVADAGHELRTPLANLKAELELALRQPRSGAELAEAIYSAAEETDRLAVLAEDLLLIARADERRLALHPTRISAATLLRHVADRFEPRARDADRAIEVDAPAGLALDGDVARLEQALGNVVENALAHGGGTVRLSAAERNKHVELHVRDDGAGFPGDFLPHAFDRFSRADTARLGGRTGLGLAIAAAIAEAHGGSAHAENRNGAGADVWLALPRRG